MRYQFLFTGMILIGHFVWGQSPTPLTLKQCVETGLANNLLVKQAGLQMEAGAVGFNQAKDNLLPQVSGGITHYLNQGRSINPANNGYINSQLTSANYNLNGSATLFNGFRLLNALKQTHYGLEAGKMDFQQAKDKLMLDIILAYLQVLNNADLLAQGIRQVAVTKEQMDRLEILNKEGGIKPSDLFDMKGQLSADQLAVSGYQNALDLARYSLAQLMNTSYNKDLAVAPIDADQFDMNYGSNPDSIYLLAVKQLSLIKSTEYRSKSYGKALSVARGNFYPNLYLAGGISTNYSSIATDAQNNKISYGDQFRNNYGTYVGAGINIPILNNLRYRNQVALAKIDLRNADAIQSTSKIQLKQNIEKDYFNMTATLNRYLLLMEQVDAYTESFRAATIRFNQGVTSSVEYLIAKNKLDQSKTNLIIARYEYLLRIKILDYYQGKPLW